MLVHLKQHGIWLKGQEKSPALICRTCASSPSWLAANSSPQETKPKLCPWKREAKLLWKVAATMLSGWFILGAVMHDELF